LAVGNIRAITGPSALFCMGKNGALKTE